LEEPREEPRNINGLSGWQIIAAARRHLREHMPYLDSAVLMLAPVEARGLGTVAVTETMILLVDLEYVVQQSVEAMAADLAHEISHILRDTHGRTVRLGCCTDEQFKISNIASDIAINPDIEAAGLPIITAPVPGAHAKQFGLPDGLMHEEYYFALIKMAEKSGGKLKFRCGGMPTKGQGKGAKGQGQGQGQGQGDGDDDAPSCGRGWCGSGGGHAVPNEPSQDDAAGRDPSQVNNGNQGYPGRTTSEIDRARRHVAEAIIKAAAAGRGNVPGGWQRWAGEVLEAPRIPWQQKLARMARQAVRYRMGACDLKYNDVSRRQAGVGYGPGRPIMPKFKAPVPEVEIVIDTSGSMGEEDFDNAMPELAGVMRAVGAEVSYVAIDADIHVDKKVKHWNEIRENLRGGGGTVFTPYFERLASKKRAPNVVLFVTDGDAGGVPSEPPPGISWIWILTGSGDRPPASWGEAINITDDA
jgi:predicted metal-dependent peptidase